MTASQTLSRLSAKAQPHCCNHHHQHHCPHYHCPHSLHCRLPQVLEIVLSAIISAVGKGDIKRLEEYLCQELKGVIEAVYMVGFFKHVWQLCKLDDLGVIRGGIVIVAGEYFVSEPVLL